MNKDNKKMGKGEIVKAQDEIKTVGTLFFTPKK